MDSYLLVHKYILFSVFQQCEISNILHSRVASLNVRDDSEIDWKQLPDENWNVWSAHQLQRRWKTLKDSIKDSKHMSHTGRVHTLTFFSIPHPDQVSEIMEILKNKKAQSPPPPAKKKGKAATSAEVIDDSDDEAGGSGPVAGSSTGPGTAATHT